MENSDLIRQWLSKYAPTYQKPQQNIQALPNYSPNQPAQVWGGSNNIQTYTGPQNAYRVIQNSAGVYNNPVANARRMASVPTAQQPVNTVNPYLTQAPAYNNPATDLKEIAKIAAQKIYNDPNSKLAQALKYGPQMQNLPNNYAGNTSYADYYLKKNRNNQPLPKHFTTVSNNSNQQLSPDVQAWFQGGNNIQQSSSQTSAPAMSAADSAQIEQLKQEWAQAYAAGDKAKADQAHAQAEAIRAKYGYSGGVDGSEINTFPVYFNSNDSQVPSVNSFGTGSMTNPDTSGSFSYNPDNDPLYQIYAEKYAKEGKAAADNTLQELAAMTGGLPSSYAAAAAAGVAQSYAQKATEMIPQLEQQAYNKYIDARDYNYNKSINDRNFSYQAYHDALRDEWDREQAAQAQANWDKTFGYNASQDAQSQSNWETEQKAKAAAAALDQANWQKTYDLNAKQASDYAKTFKIDSQYVTHLQNSFADRYDSAIHNGLSTTNALPTALKYIINNLEPEIIDSPDAFNSYMQELETYIHYQYGYSPATVEMYINNILSQGSNGKN